MRGAVLLVPSRQHAACVNGVTSGCTIDRVPQGTTPLSLMLPSDSPMAPRFHEQISLAGDFTTPGFRHGSSRPIPEAVVSRVNLFRRQLRTEHRSNFVSVVFESLRHGTPLAGGDVKRALEECVDTSVSADATLLRSMLAATALLENGTL